MSKTIVMIHGMFGYSGWWNAYKPLFEEAGYTVITPTLRFHDDRYKDHPPKELGLVGMRDYAADLAEEIRALGETPVVMGHSMGGLLALMLAGEGLAERAVLLSSCTPSGIDLFSVKGVAVLMNVLFTPGFKAKPIKISYRGALKGGLDVLEVADAKKAYSAFRFDSGRALHEIAFWKRDESKATAVDPGSITCPMFVAGGALDAMVPIRGQRAMAEAYGPNTTFKEFPSHTHHVLDGPGWEEVATSVLEWLESTDPDKG